MIQASLFSRLLSANPFFAGLSPEGLESIAQICQQRRLPQRQVLFLKGDAGDGLYAIRRGQIRIGTTDDAGQHMTMSLLGSGDVFGEIALLDGRPRTADAVAIEETEMFFVPRREFLHLLGREPTIAIQLIELLCDRLRNMSERMEEGAFLPAATRLARRLVTLVTDYGAEIHVSQDELAALTGVSRETVNRQLQQWKRVGLLSLGRSRVMIHDVDGVRRLAKVEMA
ncbi:Crp/Fnr family transcriptional regulator [Bosea caraganae]|uniref:Crp/Fnr family transcriptional regulator n=1 Tax=Bosea caraganae TaxID=2763117 RepID=A0A370L9V8_9HYPH|nr:Crp/Fnr family transcriptional regulator [Bosea caraganae]RDJ21861.1 Crp/Fnr family transcriptional regulator [Bosea caraganae]RDJ28108.1 Crp/Fnr family transcriptional regulator [Bosea caraganae]